MSNIINLMLNAGHCISGAYTGAYNGIYSEARLVRDVVNKTSQKLKGYDGINIIINNVDTYNKKFKDDLHEICYKENNSSIDAFISVHLNAGGGYGTEAFYIKGASSGTKNLANKLGQECANYSGKLRRVCADRDYYGYNLYVLKNTKASAVLVELCFIDNANDMRKFNADKYAEKLCNAIVKHYNLKKKAVIENEQLYRVRPSVNDVKNQKGAYSDLNNAKDCANKYKMNIYDSSMKLVYSAQNQLYRVRPSVNDAKGQKGAYKDFDNAKECADKYKINVYDKDMKLIYKAN